MTREKIMVDLFGFSAPTYYKWTKHQKRKIFDLLDYAFTQKELEEYLTTNRIKRVDKQHDFEILEKSVLIFLTKLYKESFLFVCFFFQTTESFLTICYLN